MPTDKERDDFWDISKLVPRTKHTAPRFADVIAPSEHTVPGDERDVRDGKIDFSAYTAQSAAEEKCYVPNGNGLIKRVSVKRFLDKYDFYGSFRKAALVYYDYKTDKCDFAPFYSYMPQYSQLTAAQKSYYFYWRDSVRRGKYIKCDYSYLYLYVYEILNLPDKIKPEDAIVLLCRLWREYRVALPRIDAYFALWVQDFCLVYGLEYPRDEISEFLYDVLALSQFKEFYLSDADLTSDAGIDALLAYLSDYDWRSGKYSGGEHRDLYAKYMRLSMGRLLFHLREDGLLYGSADTATTRRDAFAHSLCTHAVKCKLEIEYIPLSRDATLRAIVTGGVRYTENRLRALFGVKSRLLVRDFDDKYKRTIDRFFDGLIEGAKRKMAKREEPEYYSLYDAPSTGISISGADEIERDSWSTTARLVPEDEIDFVTPTVSEQNTPDIAEKVDALPCNENTSDTYGLSVADIRALNSLLRGESSITDPTLAERINESFYDGFGDVILEECSGSYTIIEDYYEEVAEWLSTQTI